MRMKLLALCHIASILSLGGVGAASGPRDAGIGSKGFSCFEYNSNHKGGELFRLYTPSPEECRASCESDEQCSFFAHHVLTSICVLRKGATYEDQQQRINVVSGPRKCLACGEEGRGYAGQPADSSSANSATHCQHLCASNEECQVFSFDTTSNKCEMHSGSSGLKEDARKISGPKECSAAGGGNESPGQGGTSSLPAPTCAVRNVKYGENSLTTEDANDATECQNLCKASPSCEAFSYDTAAKKCHLKLAVAEGNKLGDPGFISGSKECLTTCQRSDTEYGESSVLKDLPSGLSNAEECQLRCQATEGCEEWLYETGSTRCTLLRSGSNPKKADGKAIGPKYCPGACDVVGYHAPAISGTWYKTLELKTVEECRDACAKESKCEVFTSWPGNKCFLKEATCLRNLEPHNDRQLGWPKCSTCFRQGVGYKADESALLWQLETLNAEECRSRCALMEICTRFTYDAAAKSCSLLSGETDDIQGENLQSGPANCIRDNSCIMRDTQWQNNRNFYTEENQTPESCQELCASYPQCRFFTLLLRGGSCYLKTGTDGKPIRRIKFNGWVAGNKKCIKRSGLCEEKETDYPLSDINSSPMALKNVEECRDACYKEAQCRVYTFNHRSSWCWLKTIQSFTRRKSAKTGTSGARLGCPKCLRGGVSYGGNVIKEIQSPSAVHCQLSCEAESKCKFFTLETNGKCRLMDSMGKVKAATIATLSGPKQC